jgi:hypothetical protein
LARLLLLIMDLSSWTKIDRLFFFFLSSSSICCYTHTIVTPFSRLIAQGLNYLGDTPIFFFFFFYRTNNLITSSTNIYLIVLLVVCCYFPRAAGFFFLGLAFHSLLCWHFHSHFL